MPAHSITPGHSLEDVARRVRTQALAGLMHPDTGWRIEKGPTRRERERLRISAESLERRVQGVHVPDGVSHLSLGIRLKGAQVERYRQTHCR